MIVTFSVANYRSFDSEETLSLVASKRLAGVHEDHAVPIPGSPTGERVLKLGILYGANGAGKSNLLKALNFFAGLAVKTRDRSSPMQREPFAFGGKSERTTDFDIQFLAQDLVYRYGLKISDERVLEEWLVEIDGDQEKTIFERSTSDGGQVAVELGNEANQSDAVVALARVGGPANQSFLATARANLRLEDLPSQLAATIDWFSRTLMADPRVLGDKNLAYFIDRDHQTRAGLGDYLNSWSTGVTGIEIARRLVKEDFLGLPLSADAIVEILSIPDAAEKLSELDLEFGAQGGRGVIAHRGNDGKLYELSVRTAHAGVENGNVGLDLEQESDGTRRLLRLLTSLFFKVPKVFVLDEVEQSLHPKLAWEFLGAFFRQTVRSQLLVTSHESNLLDLELLRRDEIWFAEKDDREATRLYSLLDFEVRSDSEIRKHYLQGRFGAIPFMGDIKRIVRREASA